MTQIKVKPETVNGVRCADFPTYRLIKEIDANTWLIEVPNEYCDDKGQIDNKKIRELYNYTTVEMQKANPVKKAQMAAIRDKCKATDYKSKVKS